MSAYLKNEGGKTHSWTITVVDPGPNCLSQLSYEKQVGNYSHFLNCDLALPHPHTQNNLSPADLTEFVQLTEEVVRRGQ